VIENNPNKSVHTIPCRCRVTESVTATLSAEIMMTPGEFIENLKAELETREGLYFSPEQETQVAILIKSMNLDVSQSGAMQKIVRLLIQDTAYGLICGIEGSGSLGNHQGPHKLIAESGDELTGELDALFFEQILDEEST